MDLSTLAPHWQPHPGQAEFLQSQANIKVLACGRRWGKTDACAAQIVLALQESSPTRHLIVAPTLDQARLLFDRVLDLLHRLDVKPKVRLSPYPKLEHDEHTVSARSGHNPYALRGQEATHIIVDEAAYVDEKLINDTLMPMLATTGGQITLVSTPNGYNTFYRYFERGQAGESGIRSRRAPTGENPHVRPGFLAAQRELVSERTYRTEYEAEFLDAQGAVFKSELIDAALADDMGDLREPFFIGIDWGRYRDATAYAVLSGTRQGVALAQLGTVPGTFWSTQFEMLKPMLERYSEPVVYVDNSQMSTAKEMFQEHVPDVPLRSYDFNRKSKEELIDRLVALFERRVIRIPPHHQLLRELRAFRFVNGKLEGSGEHDDLVIALALAAWDLPRDTGASVLEGTAKRF